MSWICGLLIPFALVGVVAIVFGAYVAFALVTEARRG